MNFVFLLVALRFTSTCELSQGGNYYFLELFGSITKYLLICSNVFIW